MTTIERSTGCGNSPRNKAVEDLAVALETGSLDEDLLDDAANWHCDDGQTLATRRAIVARLSQAASPSHVNIMRVTSHGRVGAAYGQAKRPGETSTFAHFFVFTSASAKKLASIESFRKLER